MNLFEKQDPGDVPMNQQRHEPEVPPRLRIRAPVQKIKKGQNNRSCIGCSTFTLALLALAVVLETIVLAQTGWLEAIFKQLIVSGRTVYTRWGSSSCPNIPGTELVYSGRVGGSRWEERSGSNYLCMPEDPEYTLPIKPGIQGDSTIWGAEYEYPVREEIAGSYYYKVPCAVCHVTTRETVLMIPAKTSCPSSWTREYEGYLMSSLKTYKPGIEELSSSTMFECVDKGQEILPDTQENTDGALLYHVEAVCSRSTGLPCPPYEGEKELTCVVCTK